MGEEDRKLTYSMLWEAVHKVDIEKLDAEVDVFVGSFVERRYRCIENREGRAEPRSIRCSVNEKEAGLLCSKDCFVW